MEGWIKLHRQLLDWEWYSNINVKILFIHILLKANHADNNWRGMEIKKGQFFTSTKHLSIETLLSEKVVRNCLTKLEKTKEIEVKRASNGTMITVCKYDSYQQNDNTMGKQRANKGQTMGKQRATNKNDNNEKNIFLAQTQFYDNEIKTAQLYKQQNTETTAPDKYLKFVDWLLYRNGAVKLDAAGNQIGKPKQNLLKIKQQLSFNEFGTLLSKHGDKLSEIFDRMENWKDLSKNLTIYKTADNWLRRDEK